ncbi:SdiA-regulated domain-containing protein [Hydrogenophaga palleronii]|uniref:SdiA-regulated domain-containing protein n=1 Tax=Hydrogenophaga palleronii TaxID=65655 RepID=UPI000A71187B|nr:SdiA-regulated domain-containing protein [Hydrogenophaga palleronii]
MHLLRKRWVWVTLITLAVLFVWYFKVLTLGYYWASTSLRAAQWQGKSLWLPDYRVTVEALPVQGLSRNASGLTFNTETGTLFTVINRPPQVAELTPDGQLLRVIALNGVKDPEGITHVQGDTYVVSDESSHTMYWVKIGADATRASVQGSSSLGLGIDTVHNSSFEGVSWDSRHDRLYVVKEKLPLRVLVISGLDVFNESRGFNIDISEWQSSRSASLFMSDLSSLTLHDPTGHLLLLSDESALIAEYAPDGQPVSVMPLWRGLHGLRRKVPQPEGLAVGPDGAIYVLSEPNLFYRFERPKRPPG